MRVVICPDKFAGTLTAVEAAEAIAAMSAIEQPAARSGSTTRCASPVRMSALSAMKWTPQKTTYSIPFCAAAKRESSKLSPV